MIKQAKVYRTPGIYKIINRITKDFYIGSSMDCYKRMYQHQTLLRHNKHHAPHLQRAWNKYGQENFEYIVLEYVDTESVVELRTVEQKYLIDLSPVYNVSKDAISSLSTKFSPRKKSHTDKILPQNKSNWDDVKQKISKTVKSLWADPLFRGQQLSCMNSDSAKSNYSGSMKRRWKSQEYKERFSNSFRDNFVSGKSRNNKSRGIQNVDDVIKIRELYSTGNYTKAELGIMFSVARSTIHRILSGESWGFVVTL